MHGISLSDHSFSIAKSLKHGRLQVEFINTVSIKSAIRILNSKRSIVDPAQELFCFQMLWFFAP